MLNTNKKNAKNAAGTPPVARLRALFTGAAFAGTVVAGALGATSALGTLTENARAAHAQTATVSEAGLLATWKPVAASPAAVAMLALSPAMAASNATVPEIAANKEDRGRVMRTDWTFRTGECAK